MEEEKVQVLAAAVHVAASIVEYAVVMAVQYMDIMGDDSVCGQVRQGCTSIMAQLDAIQASAIFHRSGKRKRKLKLLARKRPLSDQSGAPCLMDLGELPPVAQNASW